MPIPANIFDGLPPYGTTGVTIGATTFVVENCNATPSSSTAEDQTATGNPSRRRDTKGRTSVSFTLQLPSLATTYPVPGTTFTYPVPNEGNMNLVVSYDVPFESTNAPGDIRTLKFTAWQVILGITTS